MSYKRRPTPPLRPTQQKKHGSSERYEQSVTHSRSTPVENNFSNPKDTQLSFVKREDVPKAIVSFLRKNTTASPTVPSSDHIPEEPTKKSNCSPANNVNQKPLPRETFTQSGISFIPKAPAKDLKEPTFVNEDDRIRWIVQQQNSRLNSVGRTIEITRPISRVFDKKGESKTANNPSTPEQQSKNRSTSRRDRSLSRERHSSPARSKERLPKRSRHSRSPSPYYGRIRSRSPPYYSRYRSSSPLYRHRSPSPLYRGRSPSPLYRGRSPSPLYRDRSPRRRYDRSFSPDRYRNMSPPPYYRTRSPSPRRRSPSPYYMRRSPSPKSRNNRKSSATASSTKNTTVKHVEKRSVENKSTHKKLDSGTSVKVNTKKTVTRDSLSASKDKPPTVSSTTSKGGKRSVETFTKSSQASKSSTPTQKKPSAPIYIDLTTKDDEDDEDAFIANARHDISKKGYTLQLDKDTKESPIKTTKMTEPAAATVDSLKKSNDTTVPEKVKRPHRRFTDTPVISDPVSMTIKQKDNLSSLVDQSSVKSVAPTKRKSFMTTKELYRLPIDERDDVVVDVIPSPPVVIKKPRTDSTVKPTEPTIKPTESIARTAKSTEAPKTDKITCPADNAPTPTQENPIHSSKSVQDTRVQDSSTTESNENTTNSSISTETSTSTVVKDNKSMPINVNQPIVCPPVQSKPTPPQIVIPSAPIIDTSVTTASPKAKRSRLPPGWKVRMSNDGDIYYHNSKTGEESFTRPE